MHCNALLLLIAIGLSCATAQSAASNLPKATDAKHVVVYQENGKFAGWPANNGAWLFDNDEMLVGFTVGIYEKVEKGHNIAKPRKSYLARSLNGGETWTAWNPENYVGDASSKMIQKREITPEPIDFEAPGFAMRFVGTAYHGAGDGGGHYFYSYDKGHNWRGPYSFGGLIRQSEFKDIKYTDMTPRTDYVVTDANECYLFLSCRPNRDGYMKDRLFCAKTSDGGRSFEFLNWIVPPMQRSTAPENLRIQLAGGLELKAHPHKARAVMSSTLRMPSGKFVSVMRRKIRKGGEKNWVDCYASFDNGKTWEYQSVVGDAGGTNGNPPAMALIQDGRLCVVWGDRNSKRMLAIYSADEGNSWSTPEVIRDDYDSEDGEAMDLGYPRLLNREDGKLCAIYYWSTKDSLHNISATIWTPGK